MRRGRSLLPVLLLLTGPACGGGAIGDPAPACEPGQTRGCTCPAGEPGTQVCESQGWSACAGCPVPDLICRGGECTDEAASLVWQQRPSQQIFRWDEALTYCDQLELGGESGWRLPTVDELRSLVRDCDAARPGGICGVTESCREPWCGQENCNGCPWNEGPGANGCYWPPELEGDCWGYWSLSKLDDGTNSSAWYLVFDSGKIGALLLGSEYFARCVRRI